MVLCLVTQKGFYIGQADRQCSGAVLGHLRGGSTVARQTVLLYQCSAVLVNLCAVVLRSLWILIIVIPIINIQLSYQDAQS